MPQTRRSRGVQAPATSTTAIADTDYTAGHGRFRGSALVRFDARTAARLTEEGLEPVDVALTFTGIGHEAKRVAE
jgi:hypothetical protein